MTPRKTRKGQLTLVAVPLTVLMLACRGLAAEETQLTPPPAPSLESPQTTSLAVAQPLPPSPAAPAPTRTRRDLRGLAVFGLAVASQAALWLVPGGLAIEGYSESVKEWAYGAYFLASPAVSAAFGHWLGKRAQTTVPRYTPMLLGGYIGSVVAAALMLTYYETDDPKVDGKYDPIYYQEGDARRAFAFFSLGVLPIVLPAAGIAIGYALGRRPVEEQPATASKAPRLELRPPMMAVLPGHRSGHSPTIALQLFSGRF